MSGIGDAVRRWQQPVVRAQGVRNVSLSGSGTPGRNFGFESDGPKPRPRSPGPKPPVRQPVKPFRPPPPPKPTVSPRPVRNEAILDDRISTQQAPAIAIPVPPSRIETVSPSIGISPDLIVTNAIRFWGRTVGNAMGLVVTGTPAAAPGTPGPDFASGEMAAGVASASLAEMAITLHYQEQAFANGTEVVWTSPRAVVIVPADIETPMPPLWYQGRVEIDELPSVGDPATYNQPVNDRAVGSAQPVFRPSTDVYEGDYEWDDAFQRSDVSIRRDWSRGLGFETSVPNRPSLTVPRVPDIPVDLPTVRPVVPEVPSVDVPVPVDPVTPDDGHTMPGVRPIDPVADNIRQLQFVAIRIRDGGFALRTTWRDPKPGRPKRDRHRRKERNNRAVDRLLHVVNTVWGSISETVDLYQAIAWAVYVRLPNGDVVPALTQMTHQQMLQGLAEGDPSIAVDLVGVVENVVLMEILDGLAGRTGQLVAGQTRNVFDHPLGYQTYNMVDLVERLQDLPAAEEPNYGFLSSLPGAQSVQNALDIRAQTREERVQALFTT